MAIKVGGTEVVDNNRQLKNIASVDATTVAALGNAGIGGGGGTVDFTASGSLSNGNLVKLNSNGTVSVLAGGGAGSAANFETDTTHDIGATFDSNSNKVVIAYRDSPNNNYGTAVVGTISGSSISFGTPVVYETAEANYNTPVFDSNSNKVVIAYRDSGNSSYGTAVVGTVSGTSISFGTPVVFESAETNYIAAIFDTDSNKVVIGYQDNGNSNKGTAIVGTVSGTSISFGNHAIFEDGRAEEVTAAFDSNSNRTVFAYRDTANQNYGTAVVGEISGTSISFGTPEVFETAFSLDITATFDSNSNKVVIAYRDNGNSDFGTAIVGTVSNQSISFGDAVVFKNSKVEKMSASFDSNVNKVIIAYRDFTNSNFGAVIVGTVSGTSISFGNTSYFQSSSLGGIRIGNTFDSNSNKAVFAYQDTGDGSFGKALTFSPTDAGDWIGFASAAVSNGATATINVVSSINEGQSSLTVGSKYYLTDQATLTTTVTSGREVGRATASTKLFITQGSVS